MAFYNSRPAWYIQQDPAQPALDETVSKQQNSEQNAKKCGMRSQTTKKSRGMREKRKERREGWEETRRGKRREGLGKGGIPHSASHYLNHLQVQAEKA